MFTLSRPLKNFCLLTALMVCGFSSTSSIADARKSSNESTESSQEELLIGAWYMGTMAGKDCNLIIRRNHTLVVQNGGCFHHDPPIESSWALDSKQIEFTNKSLQRQFGRHFRMVTTDKNLVLIPEKPEMNVRKHGYVHYFCFWRNFLTNGLELSPQAESWRKRYELAQHRRQTSNVK